MEKEGQEIYATYTNTYCHPSKSITNVILLLINWYPNRLIQANLQDLKKHLSTRQDKHDAHGRVIDRRCIGYEEHDREKK